MTTPVTNSELTGEPAFWGTLLASGVQLAAAFFLPLTDTQVTLINAAILAVAGVWVAFLIRSIDNGGAIKSAILGVAQAFMALAVGFGWELKPEQNVAVMAFVGLLVAAFVRQTSRVKGEPAGRGLHSDKPISSM